MSEALYQFATLEGLRIGMYVELELGWMSHPFPKGSFKITTEKQIETIRGLGLKRVRWVPAKSDSEDAPVPEAPQPTTPVATDSDELKATDREKAAQALKLQHLDKLAAQQRGLLVCEKRFDDAIRVYKKTVEQASSNASAALRHSQDLVNGLVGDMMGNGESAIRLLSEGVGDRAAMHPVNVTVVALLLGKANGMNAAELADLGLASFLHDIGKTRLPDRVRWLQENFSPAEYKAYQEHVVLGVHLGREMGLPGPVLQAIEQHHEMMDASGFPARLTGDRLTHASKVLALVNRYETLCNPIRSAAAVTPHEALSLMFAQLKFKFDPAVLSSFIRMMGVYPPGSVVQLVDDRYAIVVSVNSTRPLKPRVVVHEPGMPKDEALILDLETAPSLGIRRSLKPASLPKPAMDYLSPRQRICYYFERVQDPDPHGAAS